MVLRSGGAAAGEIRAEADLGGLAEPRQSGGVARSMISEGLAAAEALITERHEAGILNSSQKRRSSRPVT